MLLKMNLYIEIENLMLMYSIYLREKQYFRYDFCDILKISHNKVKFYNALTNLSIIDKIFEKFTKV